MYSTPRLRRAAAQDSSSRKYFKLNETSALRRLSIYSATKRQEATAAGQSSSDSLEVFSPSKINLFLRVVRKRDDGFHDIASLFHVIDLGDSMTFAVRNDATEDILSCEMEGVPTDSSNLVIKALDLFRRQTGSNIYFDIDLRKVVPHGAGLGGGSGNAATALWAANQMAGSPASNAQLLEWSAEIGSDIPVFFSQGAAYCTGRGEIVENVESPSLGPQLQLLLVKPDVGLSTPAIFKALDLERRSSADPRQLLDSLAHEGISQHAVVNDLEQPAFDILPELQSLKRRLSEESSGRFSAVFMTGSGSTIVCAGCDQPPEFLKEDGFVANTFVQSARLLRRVGNQWYAAPAERK